MLSEAPAQPGLWKSIPSLTVSMAALLAARPAYPKGRSARVDLIYAPALCARCSYVNVLQGLFGAKQPQAIVAITHVLRCAEGDRSVRPLTETVRSPGTVLSAQKFTAG